jgi:hypothetical protein
MVGGKDGLTVSTLIPRDGNHTTGRQIGVADRHVGQDQVIFTLADVSDAPDFLEQPWSVDCDLTLTFLDKGELGFSWLYPPPVQFVLGYEPPVLQTQFIVGACDFNLTHSSFLLWALSLRHRGAEDDGRRWPFVSTAAVMEYLPLHGLTVE